MKKMFGYYLAVWAVLLVIFNVFAFISPSFTASFWIGYIFIMLSLIGQLVCARIALKGENSQKTFYRIPLLATSFGGLVISFVVGALCMLIAPMPYWVGIVLCVAALAVNLVAVIRIAAAIDFVSTADEKTKKQTCFIRSLTADAECLLSKANSESMKAECRKVYEAVRYSDPVSNDALAEAEAEISEVFAKLSCAVSDSSEETVSALVHELLVLIDSRNRKCKLLK